VGAGPGGRWSLVRDLVRGEVHSTERAHAWAATLLERHGIVARETAAVEALGGGFGGIYQVLRSMEEAGRVRRGYFVEGLGGAQFTYPGVVDRLRRERDAHRPRHVVVLAATDPANPYGWLLPWPPLQDARRPRRPRRAAGAAVVLLDGEPMLYVDRNGRRLRTFCAATDDSLRARCPHCATSRAAGPAARSLERVGDELAIRSPLAPLLRRPASRRTTAPCGCGVMARVRPLSHARRRYHPPHRRRAAARARGPHPGPRLRAGSRRRRRAGRPRVERVHALGKHLLIDIEGGWTLRVHLGMHGKWCGGTHRSGRRARRRWCWSPATARSTACAPTPPSSCARRARDARQTGAARPRPAGGVAGHRRGRAPRVAAGAYAGREIGDVLLDQRVAAGIGNVWKSEVLFACRVHPRARVGALGRGTLRELFETAARLMGANLATRRRESVPLRRRPEPGSVRLWVYGRAGKGCMECGGVIERFLQGEMGRSTYWSGRIGRLRRVLRRKPCFSMRR
jgi:formamidopyrimidine-DNA glycosylase